MDLNESSAASAELNGASTSTNGNTATTAKAS